MRSSPPHRPVRRQVCLRCPSCRRRRQPGRSASSVRQPRMQSYLANPTLMPPTQTKRRRRRCVRHTQHNATPPSPTRSNHLPCRAGGRSREGDPLHRRSGSQAQAQEDSLYRCAIWHRGRRRGAGLLAHREGASHRAGRTWRPASWDFPSPSRRRSTSGKTRSTGTTELERETVD